MGERFESADDQKKIEGNNVSQENFVSVETLFQNPDTEKKAILSLTDNRPKLSEFINPETYKNCTFTLKNARGASLSVGYHNGDWYILSKGKATNIRARIWKGANVISNVQTVSAEEQGKKFSSPEQKTIQEERLNWQNWDIVTVEQNNYGTWIINREKKMTVQGKSVVLKNTEYTNVLQGKAKEWWEKMYGKEEEQKAEVPLEQGTPKKPMEKTTFGTQNVTTHFDPARGEVTVIGGGDFSPEEVDISTLQDRYRNQYEDEFTKNGMPTDEKLRELHKLDVL